MIPSTCRSDRWLYAAVALTLLVSVVFAGAAWAADDPDTRYYYDGGRSIVADGTAAYVPNEYIIHVVKGTSIEMVKQAVDSMGATLVRSIAVPDTYLIRLGRSSDSRSPRYIVSSSRSTSSSKISSVRGYGMAVIDRIQPNVIYRPTVEPTSDALWSEQWDMRLIKMPAAWGIEKGQATIPGLGAQNVVAVIDSGVAYTHPDLVGRCVQGYDTFDNDNDPFDTPPGDGVGHGTHVAGTIAAQGDNGEGICGVCWNGVKIMPVRALGPVDDNTTAGTTETITAAMEYALTHGAQVVNMSLGGPARLGDGVYRAKAAQLAQAGVIVVVAAGNDGDTSNPEVGVPALYPEVIAVGSVGHDDRIAAYSSYGPAYEVDIAAPGGYPYLDDNNELQGFVWSTHITWVQDEEDDTLWYGFYDYKGMVGTSMACPHVAGAAALLLSQGVPANQVRNRLLDTARAPASPIVMDPRKYGAGILDVQAALNNSSIRIVKPGKGSTVSGTPDFEITWRGVDATSVKVYVDYADDNRDGVPDNPGAETPVVNGVNAAQTGLSFKWSDYFSTPLSAATNPHVVYVTANSKVGGAPVADYVSFNVSNRNVSGGLHLFSLPYVLDTTTVSPSSVLTGADFSITNPNRSVLQRYLTPTVQYATYVPGLFNDRCWVLPLFSQDVPSGGGYYDLVKLDDNGRVLDRKANQFAFPAGAGFWLSLPPQTTIPIDESLPTLTNLQRADGYVFDQSRGLKIRLYQGWNMIGNPFDHSVAWNSLKVTYQGQSLSWPDAVAVGWLQPYLFRYRTTGTPGYDRLTSGDNLEPYEGYWLRAEVGSTDPRQSLMLTILP